MSSYTITVAKSGVHLFQTEEQPDGNGALKDKVLGHIVDKFPAAEGFEVVLVNWPDREGEYRVIHKPE